MFISVLELFKIGIGPSSSHTLGPMVAAGRFIEQISQLIPSLPTAEDTQLRCTLRGSLAFTGRGHASDRAVSLGLHGYQARNLLNTNIDLLIKQLWARKQIVLESGHSVGFAPHTDIIFDRGEPLPEHPNGMIFELLNAQGERLAKTTFFSIGGGFISTPEEISGLEAPLIMTPSETCTYPFDSAKSMLQMAEESGQSIAAMKRINERQHLSEQKLNQGIDEIWQSMCTCIERGLTSQGTLPGGLAIKRRASDLYRQLQESPANANINDWLCAYAMAVNEENAAGNMVVTAPTNGAAGVIPAVLYYFMQHENGTPAQVHEFLLTASAIGGLIKHRSSISGAEVGCQGEVGSAAAMAAASLCAIRGGTPEQIENAAEIALEHHLGMTCDPVNGLVQVPCIERNGFGAIKAYTAASLALRGTGEHFMPLDSCIAAMRETGLEMSQKFKETSLGGLAVSITEC
ncbi:L-serine ammonia-lyase [Solemya pervernicosa gill symbiont]|uniref:L-serine dehydratase n=2 Tax=Gammaproteobacteria incertae sedis TaxID=118884 RepID=A0A1T2L132_9GAMM|nr:L-serine ammonia-lyase [Candidatus Reidiella endopervernicosa]OOZ38730.1 L-serine ammonia-lyase [Solemya pervernicosa gill symbiont]QKQ25845.1 L-serine ammonia-lyase [Candidatus Reidiella endopervernicosa]